MIECPKKRATLGCEELKKLAFQAVTKFIDQFIDHLKDPWTVQRVTVSACSPAAEASSMVNLGETPRVENSATTATGSVAESTL